MPQDPKRLKIINRIVEVLKTIQAGADYFYTPYEVTKRFVHWKEARGFPTYMVHSGSGGEIIQTSTDQYDEIFYISIKGIVQDNQDTITKLERAIRDIRKAINDDSVSPEPGSLGELAVQVIFDKSPETDNGYLSLEGFGFFDQEVRVRISGNFGEL